ncbi:MAG: group II intron maturase-specific domain-containing protein [Actinomycetes bacterium]
MEPKAAKTPIVHLQEGGEGFDLLGFRHRWVATRAAHRTCRLPLLARWPSRKAVRHARDRIRELTARSRLAVPVEYVVRDVNLFVRGWAGCFRYGSSAESFDKISAYADERVCLFVGKRHKRRHRYGQALLIRSGNRFGLINLNGTVVAPGRTGPGGLRLNTAGEGRR